MGLHPTAIILKQATTAFLVYVNCDSDIFFLNFKNDKYVPHPVGWLLQKTNKTK